MRWNILIGIFAVALGAVQLGIAAVAYFDPDRGMLGYGDIIFTATSGVALLLSYPLLRADNWARIVLVALLSCCGIGVLLLVPYLFIANHWIYTRVIIALSGLSTFCVIMLFIFVLLHPDIRRDFDRKRAIPREIV